MNTVELAKYIRSDALYMTHKGKASHIGAILSVADIVAVLYGKVMNIDPKKPNLENRDRFVLSKGHSGVAVYSALARRGFFSVDKLKNYYTLGSTLSGHVSHVENAGVECSTGSLGQGITIAVGMALAGKMDKKNYRVFTVLGDGECGEGSVWEAAGFAGTNKLDNLVVVVDKNNLQLFGDTTNILDQRMLAQKFECFGFETVCVDGHNHTELEKALTKKPNGKPLCVIASTIKGKGVSFMENKFEWHGKTVNDEELLIAQKEVLGGKANA